MIFPKQLYDVNAFVDVKIPSPKDFYTRYGFRPQGGYLPNDLPLPESSNTISDIVATQKYVEQLQERNKAATEA